jgi:hypothetical protein
MTENTIEEDICSIEDEEENAQPKVNSFSDAVKSIANVSFKNHEEKTSNISVKNATGIARCKVLNEWKYRNYGYRHNSLDMLIVEIPKHRMSASGFGIKTLAEMLKGIGISFEQTEIPERLRDRIGR